MKRRNEYGRHEHPLREAKDGLSILRRIEAIPYVTRVIVGKRNFATAHKKINISRIEDNRVILKVRVETGLFTIFVMCGKGHSNAVATQAADMEIA